MNKFETWLIKSSADPEKVSMTIKGVLLTWVSMILLLCQIFHIHITQEWLTNLIQQTTAFIGAILVVVGMVRKIILTLQARKTS